MRLSKTQKFWMIVLLVILAGLIFFAGIISGLMISSVQHGSGASAQTKSASASNQSGLIGMMTFLGNAITRPVETASEWDAKKKKSEEAKQQAANDNKKSETKAGGDKPPESQPDKAQDSPASEKKKPSTTRFWVEVDSYALKTKASERVKELKTKGYSGACIVKSNESVQDLYIVQIGDFDTSDDAAVAAYEFKKKDGGIAIVNSMSAAIFEQKKDCKGGEGG